MLWEALNFLFRELLETIVVVHDVMSQLHVARPNESPKPKKAAMATRLILHRGMICPHVNIHLFVTGLYGGARCKKNKTQLSACSGQCPEI